MRRWRFSLRSFLLYVVTAAALISVVGSKLATGLRGELSDRWLRANGTYVGYEETGRRTWTSWLGKTEMAWVGVAKLDMDQYPNGWKHIHNLGNLRYLDVGGDDCDSNECIRVLRDNASTLRELHFSDCKLSPRLAKTISDCQSLERLVFAGNATDLRDAEIQQLPRLQMVSVQCTNPTEGKLRWIGCQQVLETLYLCKGPLDDSTMEAIAEAPKLTEIDLQTAQVSHASICRLLKCKSLKRLDFPKTTFGADDVKSIRKSNLELVDLRKVDRTVEDLEQLLSCENLRFAKLNFADFNLAELPQSRCSPLRLVLHNVSGCAEYDERTFGNVTIAWSYY